VGHIAGDEQLMRRLFGPRRGQATVEFALMATILFLLTMGVVDLSMAVWEYNTVSWLAREGARYAIVPSRTPTQIQDYVVSRGVLPWFSTSNVAVTDRGTCGVVADPVVVTVTYQYTPASPMIALAAGSAINLQASSSMFVEAGAATDCGCGGSCT
jgi:hypothetical protein